MRLAFITCYYGRKKHVALTETWYAAIGASIAAARREHPALEAEVYVLNNAAVTSADLPGAHHARSERNLGFANGMGHGLARAFERGFDYYCVINNDVRMPEPAWLARVLDAVPSETERRTQTLLPVASHHKGKAFETEASLDEDPWDLPWGPGPAVCWFLPHHQVRFLKEHYGVWVFHPDFPIGWYEDDLAVQMLFAHYERPFRVVPRAFLEHIGSATTNDRRLFGRKRRYRQEARLIYERLLEHYSFEDGIRPFRRPRFAVDGRIVEAKEDAPQGT